jgi:NAD-dependent SIR2 family protein deacetylase
LRAPNPSKRVQGDARVDTVPASPLATNGGAATHYACLDVWISDVDVPEELLEAARAGTLVVFVGAGASRDAPSNLPDFRQLTSSIAAEAALVVKPEELDVPDRLLGRIGDAGVDVHQRVRARIDTPGSAPNALHEAIVDLASATRAPRIVTTNYDSHLTSVVRARGLPWAEYTAPALPMGDDFEGVVYLHGSLRQESRNLIVTDAD